MLTQYDQVCKKCPEQASFCQGKAIQLQLGFWRESDQDLDDDQILYCQNNPQNCQEQYPNQIKGCIEGYIGPLCETCDSFGVVWNQRYTKTYTSKYKCNLCSQLIFQVLVILVIVLFIILYGLSSTFMFMNNFIYIQKCFYLRQMSILPISKSSQKDYSSFYLKILINYLQIIQYILKFQLSNLQEYISTSLDLMQSPQQQLQNSTDCLINSLIDNRIQRIKYNLILEVANPIFLLLIMGFILLIFKKLGFLQVSKYHFYTIMNVIFIFYQPSSIVYFIQSLSCRQISNKRYTQLDITIDCYNQEYENFVYFFSSTIILVYILIPFYIFHQIRKAKLKLNYCQVRFKYGYYYTEYKPQFFYWDLIRINFRVFIFIIFTVLEQNSDISYLIISFSISLYLILIIILSPIQNFSMLKIEIYTKINILIQIIIYRLSIYYQLTIAQYIIHMFHLIYIFYLILLIFNQKIKSSLNFFGKIFRALLRCLLSKEAFNKFINKNQTSFQAYKRWRFLKLMIKQILLQNNYQKLKKHSNSRNHKSCIDLKISQFINQNSFLIQSKLSSSPKTPNKINISNILTNSISTLHKKQTFKSNFGTPKKGKELQEHLNDQFNFEKQNTSQYYDTQYKFNQNNTNEVVMLDNTNLASIQNENSLFQKKHDVQQNQINQYSFCHEISSNQVNEQY
ncbi:transmembrane protein, putative (macronuclear) [Tetrahymena thermophila SB210]|uniref:Transmembrane protein, putative n=1 Tax=Tetrahymena thermophila (strain SB210) TaxID=312017 RepID=W7XBN5_TETTS|nr:transmembrane protein, putative [Tetrahymena thermophila SB210]EWS73803.1 transmembrane protein, putative [Tetrahymena thermophila SB210]|eukprot:XP_012653683.1 transmembrane protein, putative [Tetrahymena thermophila SB210]